jgi:hypothetical protein
MLRHIFCLIAASAGLIGCTTRVGDFTLASTKNIDFHTLASCRKETTRSKGVDEKLIIFLIPLGTPNLKSAVDRAIESIPDCTALIDVAIYAKGFWFVVGQAGYLIEGTPLVTGRGKVAHLSRTVNGKCKVIIVDERRQTSRTVDIDREELESLKKELSNIKI